MHKLDRIDLAILAALQIDGRITNVALARQVGLSPTPCLERVKSLEAHGFITGYAANLSAAALGLGLTVFIQISLDSTSQRVFETFRRSVFGIPEIQECHMIAGSFDYLLKVRVPDITAYRNFLGAVLSEIPGIRETHSYPVMEELKDSPALPLGQSSK